MQFTIPAIAVKRSLRLASTKKYNRLIPDKILGVFLFTFFFVIYLQIVAETYAMCYNSVINPLSISCALSELLKAKIIT